MQPELKKRKVDGGHEAPARRASVQVPEDKDKTNALLSKTKFPANARGVDLKIRKERDLAVAQAQEEKCTGNYRIFDSLFGLYHRWGISIYHRCVCDRETENRIQNHTPTLLMPWRRNSY